jgi:hypothetical protein
MILKFPDTQTRDRFLETVRLERADLISLMKVRSLLPHITVGKLGPEDTNWVTARVSRFGKTYQSVQMEFQAAMR